ncbi:MULTISPECIES: hypothetical protein [Arthrobacter]|uniref:hypothetical protein n=1 Tax=Arthrobacter TaxID=1663 RepID=UPI0010579E3C|nr:MULTISPECIES: hypothetical protein [Arthrobacter]
MINPIHMVPGRPQQPQRSGKDTLQDAGWTMLSVAVGLVLIPAIAIDEALRTLFPGIRRESEPDLGPYIN